MARLSTCKGCNKQLLPEEKYSHSSKTYCEECFEKIERDTNEYKKLIEYICINYDLERPTGFMLKQIKELKNEYSYSYAAMTYTLWYCKEVLNKELIEKYGVALIKHFYDEAKKYYAQQENAKEQMKKLKNVEMKTKLIKQNKTSYNNKNLLLVNIGEMLEGGDTH